MFFKLALKNIRRSLKDYAIYFFTLVLGVVIFYIFNAIETQTAMINLSDSMYNIVDTMMVILSGVSFFVALVLGFLILYASRFLIKRRSQEIGLYLTLGMSKRKISRLLLIETFLIGLISLVVGLICGIVVSQFTSALVANLFEADLTNYTFVFSASACLKTIICFGLIYLVVIIFNTINISRQKLINLLSSARQSEKIKAKNPWLCTVVFVLAVVMLAWAYYAVTGGVEDFLMEDVNMVYLVLATGGLATFLLFWSLSGLLLRIFMSWKAVYYRGLNNFTLRQFSSKINTTVFSMTVICLMLFVTICVFSSAMAIRESLNETARQALTADVIFEIARDVEVDDDGNIFITVDDALNNEKQDFPDVRDFYRQHNVAIDELFSDYAGYTVYTIPSWRLEQSLGEAFAEISTNYPALYYNRAESVMYESDYNAIAKIYSNPEIHLAKNEYVVTANYPSMVEIRNRGLATRPEITVFGQTLQPKYDHCIDASYGLSVTANSNDGVIIIPDTVKLSGEKYGSRRAIAKYNTERLDRREIDAIIEGTWLQYIGEEDKVSFFPQTRSELIDSSVGLSAMATFIGLYLGMIFLIASAAVLALKELSDSSDNRQKFDILRKIGASEQMLNRALFWQIAIFFGFPLLIAVIHSVFGIMFCNFILEAFGNMNLLQPIMLTALLIITVYGGYFLITYFCSKSMLREHRI